MIIASYKMRTSRCGFYTGPTSELAAWRIAHMRESALRMRMLMHFPAYSFVVLETCHSSAEAGGLPSFASRDTPDSANRRTQII
jgi:hypothetical protein